MPYKDSDLLGHRLKHLPVRGHTDEAFLKKLKERAPALSRIPKHLCGISISIFSGKVENFFQNLMLNMRDLSKLVYP